MSAKLNAGTAQIRSAAESWFTGDLHSDISGSPPTDKAPLGMGGLSWVLFGHAAFQYLNAACELGLFELLAEKPGLTNIQIPKELGLAERAADILLLGCTSLGMITRVGGAYRAAKVILDLMEAGDWQRFKNTVAFEHHIVYEAQTDFTESLRQNSNVGLRRIDGTSRDLYHRLGENPRLQSIFYRYMRSWSELANRHLVDGLDLSGASSLLDCGGGDGVNAIELAKANPHLKITVLDLPSTTPITENAIADAGLTAQISVASADIFADPFPDGFDCIMFVHQLVIWTLEENTRLLRKAYESLPEGGRVVIFNSMSNDTADGPVVAALDSVYFATLPAEGGMIYSWKQHEQCLFDAGFRVWQRISCPGWTPHGIIVATK